MPPCVSLETQISSVMESLSRAAVAEICKLINSECVEMRLEIRRGQKEIEDLKGKIRDLKREAQSPPSAALSFFESQSTRRDGGDSRVDDLSPAPDFENEERDKKTHIAAPLKNLQEKDVQRPSSSLPNSGSKWNQTSMFPPTESRVSLKETQILIDSLTTDAIADVSGLNNAAIKVEGGSPPASTPEGFSEMFEADPKECTNQQSHTVGDNSAVEELWPQSHYPAQFHNKHLSAEGSNYKYETDYNHVNGHSSSDGNPNELLLKTEENEEPLTKATSELAPCGMMDSEAFSWPSLTSVNFPVNSGGPGCSSMLQPATHTSQSAHPAFHLSATGEIEYTIEPETKQAGGRNLQNVIQATALGQNSMVSTLVTNAKGLPIADARHKLFSCSFCPKSFQSGTDLKRHQRIHTGEKPYGCAVCGKRFSLRGNLVTHERAHSGSKPFICRHCGRAFAHGSNLRAHQRVHTGERPFHCSLCDKTFAWYYPFKRHLSLHFLNGQNS